MKKILVLALLLSMIALSAQSAVVKPPAKAELPKPTEKAIVAPPTQQTDTGSSTTSSGTQDPKTERTWKANCAFCHGDDGKAKTSNGKLMAISDFSTPAWQKSFTGDMIKLAILNGVQRDKNGVHQHMDSFAPKLKSEQIDDLVLMVRSFGK